MIGEKPIIEGRKKGWNWEEPLRIIPKINWFVKTPFDGNVYQKSQDEDMFICSVHYMELAKLITLFPQAYMLAKSISFGKVPDQEDFKQLVSDFEKQQQEIIRKMPENHAIEMADNSSQGWLDLHPNYWALFESAVHITDKLKLEDNNDETRPRPITFIDS